ncbi:sensor histidine kinase [Streptomyces sp. H27-D2]|uniref:sensor histidine kinase n=1 Tax=Streptomyces sp. H27-D2 TaxID=3046304 RepID=UPI002DB8287C|nr:histidine kinase [Streptomyces sp. H27-D2]MEC4017966.1 histidine kinase [Streptomyces sp. H27-D2]
MRELRHIQGILHGLVRTCGPSRLAHRRWLGDIGIALLVTFASYVQTRDVWSTGLVRDVGASAAIAMIAAATLVLRRRLPVMCLAAGLAASFATDDRTPLIAAAYAVACYGGALRFPAVAVAVGAYLTTRQTVGMSADSIPQLYYGVGVDIVLPTILGGLVRHQRSLHDVLRERFTQLEGAVDNATRFALLEERTRLAFELHDHIGHQTTLLVLRAGTLQRMPGLPPEARQAAEVVMDSAHQVMCDLRQMLNVMRDTDGRQDALGNRTTCAELLEGLVRNMAAVGMDVECRVDGTPRTLSPPSEELLHRICKEAFTNVIKHAPGAVAVVDLSYAQDKVTFTMRNGSPVGPGLLGDSGRMGLIGLATRVAESGGRMVAEPQRDGGFTLEAVLPVTGGDNENEGELCSLA